MGATGNYVQRPPRRGNSLIDDPKRAGSRGPSLELPQTKSPWLWGA
jgi:hypothetical protein